MKVNTSIPLYSILVFHIVWTLFSFYTMFADFTVWTDYHWIPFLLLLFTIAWYGACREKYIFGLIYIGLVMVEFLSRAAFRDTAWVDVIKGLLFPVDLIFVAILLFLFKKHFGVLQRD